MTTAANAALRILGHADSLVVLLDRPAVFGDTVRFTIDYDARVENGHGLTFVGEPPPPCTLDSERGSPSSCRDRIGATRPACVRASGMTPTSIART